MYKEYTHPSANILDIRFENKISYLSFTDNDGDGQKDITTSPPDNAFDFIV